MPAPVALQGNPPGPLWVLVLVYTDLYSMTGEVLDSAQPGNIHLACSDEEDGWVLIGLADDCTAPAWVELGVGVELVRVSPVSER